MKKVLLLFHIILLSFCSIFAQNQTTIEQLLTRLEKSGNSYLINNITDFEWLAEQTNKGTDFYGYDFKLNTGIYQNQSYKWTPIGTKKAPFRGNFDGNGQFIEGIWIESDLTYLGLFGYVKDGVIKNLRLRYCSIKSTNTNTELKQYSGLVAGYSNSILINCYAFDHESSEWYRPIHSTYCVGGIVGKAENAVYNCYADLHYIQGTDYAGGIVGETSSIVKNCFSQIKSLNGNTKGHIVGNKLLNAKLSDNYRDIDYSAPTNGVTEIDGQGLDKNVFVNKLNENLSNYGQYFPLCIWGNEGVTAPWGDFIGEGTSEKPYLIASIDDLKRMSEKINNSQYTDKSFKMVNDIDMDKENWIPIGNNSQHTFKGSFDGNGKTISNLKMDDSYAFAGLIGYMQEGEIKNVIIHNCEIIGDNAGGLIGSAENLTATNNLVFGSINIYEGKDKSNRGRIFGAVSNIKNDHNYATGNAISSDEKDGITLIEATGEEYIINKSGNYLAEANRIIVEADQTFIFCLPTIIHSQVIFNNSTIQGGWLRTNELHFYTNTTFNKTPNAVEAEDLILHREPLEFAEKSGTGWETICLPFDANLYADENCKTPVTNKSGAFWLRAFVESTSDNDKNTIYFASHATMPVNGYAIQKNTPYIIALPGNNYGNNSLKGRSISFRGKGSLPISNEKHQKTFNNSNFIFEGCHQQEAAAGRYLLQDGTTFKWNESDTVAPYQAYFLPKGTSASNVQVLRIATGTNQPTDLTDGIAEERNIRAYVADGILYLTGDNTQQVKIWNAGSGMMVKEVEVNNGTTAVAGLTKGIYIIDREKVVIY